MSKRRAGTDLNSDNWDKEEDPEDEVRAVGFQRASDEVLAGRKIKIARRRGADAVTTGGSDKPNIFKNFSGFGSMASSGNSIPKFEFGAKKQEETSSDMKKLFEASSFKPGSSSTTSSSLPSFTFTSTSNKENSKPFESNAEPINGSADLSKKPAGYDADKQVFYEKLKALNEGVLQWIQKHVTENSLINLSPVFDDYKKHFEALEKQFKPKFSKTSSSVASESSSSYKNFSFASSSKPTNSTPPKQPEKLSLTSESTKSKPLFSFGASENKPSESASSPKDVPPSKPPPFSFTSSLGSSSSNTSDQKPKDSTALFSFGSPADGSKSNEKPAGGGFSFGAKESSGFSFGGSGGLTFGAKEGSTFSGFGSKPTMSFAPMPPAASESKAGEEDETDTPPQPEVLEVKEENSFYEKKCKLFYKKDGSFVDKGVGTLFLKPVAESKKTQLIMRAATSLGNVLLNIVLNSSLPTQRMGKNNVLIVCVPNPPLDTKEGSDKPVTMLIRVKTAEDADELYKKINENKGE